MPYITGQDRGQLMLFPESVDEYISEENPARVIDAFVDTLDLEAMGFERATPAKEGRPGYDPRDMLKLYIYGYFNKIRSSRKLQTESSRNIELMWLLSKIVPDFRCIADFRKNNPQAIKQVFREFVRLCGKLDLVSKDLIAIDGSKFKAVNSKERNFSLGKLNERIRMIDEKLLRYMNDLDQNDMLEKESTEYTKEELEQMIAELNERKVLYSEYLKELVQTGKTQKSLTDPESKLMLTGGKMDVCFNVQAAVESKNHIVADFIVTDHPNDTGLLSEVAQGAKAALDSDRIAIVADKGYRQNEDILNCLLEGDTPNVYTHEKQECYTFTFTKTDDEITDEMRISTDKETMLRCISAGVLPDILENKNLIIEVVEAYKEKTLIVDEITGEIITNRVAKESIKTAEVSNPPKQHYFKRDLHTDTVICPMGKTLHRKGFIVSKGTRYYNKLACSKCENKCTTSKYRSVDFIGKKDIVKTDFYTKDSWRFGRCPALRQGEKKVHINNFAGNEVLLKFYPDKEVLKLRGRIIEHPFGTIKRWCDGSYLLLKGRKKATADLAFSFLGYNLKRAITEIGVKGLLGRI